MIPLTAAVTLDQPTLDHLSILAERRGRPVKDPYRSPKNEDTSPSSGPPSTEKSKLEQGGVPGKSGGQNPAGTNPPRDKGGDKGKGPQTSGALSSNAKTSLGLFIATLLLGTGSVVTHFTDTFEGPTKNLLAFGFDAGTTFAGALTLSNILAPVDQDSGVHKDVIHHNSM